MRSPKIVLSLAVLVALILAAMPAQAQYYQQARPVIVDPYTGPYDGSMEYVMDGNNAMMNRLMGRVWQSWRQPWLYQYEPLQYYPGPGQMYGQPYGGYGQMPYGYQGYGQPYGYGSQFGYQQYGGRGGSSFSYYSYGNGQSGWSFSYQSSRRGRARRR